MGYYANRLYGQDAGGRARDITQGNRVTAKVRRFSSLFLAHMYSPYAHTSRSLTFLSSVPSPPSNHHIRGSFCVQKLRQVLARSVSPLAGTNPPCLADLLLGFFSFTLQPLRTRLSFSLASSRAAIFRRAVKRGKKATATAAPSSHPPRSCVEWMILGGELFRGETGTFFISLTDI